MGTRYKGMPEEVKALDGYIKLMRAASAVQSHLERRLAGAKLTENQFGVLDILHHLGPLCQKDLGEKLFTTGANITVVVDNLQKRGLVERVRSQEDRRYITVHMTDEGRNRFLEVFPGHIAEIVRMFSVLSPEEQTSFGNLSRKLGRWKEALHES